MNCGVLEPSSPTTVRFPPCSTSVLVVSAAWARAEGVDRRGLVCRTGRGEGTAPCPLSVPFPRQNPVANRLPLPPGLARSLFGAHPNPNRLSISLPLPDCACRFLSLELSIQPSLNAILIPPHLRSPAGPAALTSSSQGKPGSACRGWPRRVVLGFWQFLWGLSRPLTAEACFTVCQQPALQGNTAHVCLNANLKTNHFFGLNE